MGEAKHTAGPWKSNATGSLPGAAVWTADGREFICSLVPAGIKTPNSERMDANCRLIAAAPCLLAACEAAESEIRILARSLIDNSPFTEEHDQGRAWLLIADQLRTAIAKAKGEH
jgi:hypothetical protein